MKLAIYICLACFLMPAFAEESGDEPAELTSLRRNFERAKVTALKPIEETYRASLQGLLSELKAKGDLQASIEVSKLLETSGAPSSSGGDAFSQLLLSKTWNVDMAGKAYRLKEDGTVQLPKKGSAPVHWHRVGDDGVVFVREGRAAYFRHDPESGSFVGSSYYGDPATMK